MMVENVFNGNNNEDLKISDEDDVKIIETNRVWKICEDIKIKTEILDEIEDFSANDELVVVEDVENPFEKRITTLTAREQLVCTICRIDFPNEDEFKTHMILHSHCEPFRCGFCSKRFSRSSNLENHLQSHVDFDCNYCSLKFQ
ncbi:zinc finger protein OZF-like isoform X1, partial [Vespula maculifrons]